MTITIGWVPGRDDAILLSFRGAWTWQEFAETADPVRQMLDEVPHPVHLIAIFQASSQPPGDSFNRLPQIVGHPLMDRRHEGERYVVGARGMPTKAARLFAQVFTSLIFVETLDEVIAEMDGRPVRQ